VAHRASDASWADCHMGSVMLHAHTVIWAMMLHGLTAKWAGITIL